MTKIGRICTKSVETHIWHPEGSAGCAGRRFPAMALLIYCSELACPGTIAALGSLSLRLEAILRAKARVGYGYVPGIPRCNVREFTQLKIG